MWRKKRKFNFLIVKVLIIIFNKHNIILLFKLSWQLFWSYLKLLNWISKNELNLDAYNEKDDPLKLNSSSSLALPEIYDFAKHSIMLHKKLSKINKKSYKDFLKNQSEVEETPDRKKLKRKYHLFGTGKSKMKPPRFYDLRLLARTPDVNSRGSRDFYQFLGKSKEEFEDERNQRLLDFKKRKYDAETAILSSLSHKIEKFGKKILISSKGVKN